MEENRFPMTGTVVELTETKQISQYFRKREFKLRFSDVDFTGKVVDRLAKFVLINDSCSKFDNVAVDDIIQIMWYLDGRDYVKDGKTLNFTSCVCYEVDIISSPTRATDEDKNAVITPEGLQYKEKEATIEDAIRAGSFLEGKDDPLNNVKWPEKKNKETKPEETTKQDAPVFEPVRDAFVPPKDDPFNELPF